MNNLTIPPALHDAMIFCSRRLFDASQEGSREYAEAIIRTVIKTLNTAVEEVSNNGTH